MALGTNTDPYQPIERERRITRSILEVLERTGHPVGIVTKSALVTRDIDILSRMAARGLAKVALSVTTLDRRLARAMEPRASTPPKRIEALRQLSEAGIPTSVMVAPIIPALNDHEIEAILETAHDAGARGAGYVLLRMPLEIKDLFREWLAEEFPGPRDRVIHLMQSMHGGRDYRAEFGLRQKGSGPYAEQIALRFRLADQAAWAQPTAPAPAHRPLRAAGAKGRADEAAVELASRRLQRLLHDFRICQDYAQVVLVCLIGLGAMLLPIPQRADRNAKARRESLLRHAELLPDELRERNAPKLGGLHLRQRRIVRIATCGGDNLGGRQSVECCPIHAAGSGCTAWRLFREATTTRT